MVSVLAVERGKWFVRWRNEIDRAPVTVNELTTSRDLSIMAAK